MDSIREKIYFTHEQTDFQDFSLRGEVELEFEITKAARDSAISIKDINDALVDKKFGYRKIPLHYRAETFMTALVDYKLRKKIGNYIPGCERKFKYLYNCLLFSDPEDAEIALKWIIDVSNKNKAVRVLNKLIE